MRLAALLVLLSLPTVAWAQDEEEVRRLDENAGRFYTKGNFSLAMQALREAQRLLPADTRLYNLALCSDQAGNAFDAIELYSAFLETGIRGSHRRRAELRLAWLQHPLEVDDNAPAPEPPVEPLSPPTLTIQHEPHRGLRVGFYVSLSLALAGGLAAAVTGLTAGLVPSSSRKAWRHQLLLGTYGALAVAATAGIATIVLAIIRSHYG